MSLNDVTKLSAFTVQFLSFSTDQISGKNVSSHNTKDTSEEALFSNPISEKKSLKFFDNFEIYENS